MTLKWTCTYSIVLHPVCFISDALCASEWRVVFVWTCTEPCGGTWCRIRTVELTVPVLAPGKYCSRTLSQMLVFQVTSSPIGWYRWSTMVLTLVTAVCLTGLVQHAELYKSVAIAGPNWPDSMQCTFLSCTSMYIWYGFAHILTATTFHTYIQILLMPSFF